MGRLTLGQEVSGTVAKRPAQRTANPEWIRALTIRVREKAGNAAKPGGEIFEGTSRRPSGIDSEAKDESQRLPGRQKKRLE